MHRTMTSRGVHHRDTEDTEQRLMRESLGLARAPQTLRPTCLDKTRLGELVGADSRDVLDLDLVLVLVLVLVLDLDLVLDLNLYLNRDPKTLTLTWS
jgi:hypothetical protein